MPLPRSPIRRLKEFIRDALLSDPDVMAYLEGRVDKVSTAWYSDVGEGHLPLCIITAIKEDLDRLDNDYQERSELTVVVEFHGFVNDAIHFDDFSFHVRQKISTMQTRASLGKAFEGLQVTKIAYNRTALGTKNVQQVSFEVKTFYDIELEYMTASDFMESNLPEVRS
jgi:hypothetical protein